MNATNTLLLTALTKRIQFATNPLKFTSTVRLATPGTVRMPVLAAA